MIARHPLPERYERWNARHRAPYGRARGRRFAEPFARRGSALAARYLGPYAWQPNSTLRRFEYPWAAEQIGQLGRGLRIVDVGASLAGLQFTLARDGHDVHAVDPGIAARGRGWEIDADTHAFLARSHRAPVTLWPTTLQETNIEEGSADVVLSISTVEHFAEDDLTEFASRVRRLLRTGGTLVLTVDLFIDLEPFTSRVTNKWGRNIDIKRLLDASGVTLDKGRPDELLGFPDFAADRVQTAMGDYIVGETYPVLSQCLVARRDQAVFDAR